MSTTFGFNGIIDSYTSYMRDYVTETVMFAFLLLLYCGSTRFSAFELIRREGAQELTINLQWLIACTILTTVVFSVDFIYGLLVVLGQSPDVSLPLSGIVAVQTAMFLASLGLVQMLLVNCGLQWGQTMPVIIGVYILAPWALGVLPDAALRALIPFSFPITPELSTVVIEQVLPFIGFAIVMTIANAVAFDRREHLQS